MPDAEVLVFETVRAMLARRAAVVEVGLDSRLHDDLDLDSLELAELSAILEDELGTDPYSEGVIPRTVGEILAFYQA